MPADGGFGYDNWEGVQRPAVWLSVLQSSYAREGCTTAVVCLKTQQGWEILRIKSKRANLWILVPETDSVVLDSGGSLRQIDPQLHQVRQESVGVWEWQTFLTNSRAHQSAQVERFLSNVKFKLCPCKSVTTPSYNLIESFYLSTWSVFPVNDFIDEWAMQVCRFLWGSNIGVQCVTHGFHIENWRRDGSWGQIQRHDVALDALKNLLWGGELSCQVTTIILTLFLTLKLLLFWPKGCVISIHCTYTEWIWIHNSLWKNFLRKDTLGSSDIFTARNLFPFPCLVLRRPF